VALPAKSRGVLGKVTAAITRAGGSIVAVDRVATKAERTLRAITVECSSVEKTEYAHVSVEELGAGNARLSSRKTAVVHLTDEVARAIEALSLQRVVAARDGMILEMDSADDGWIMRESPKR